MKLFITVNILFIILFSTSVSAFQKEPDNFRGFKWGETLTKYEMSLLSEKEEIKIYSLKKDKLQIGEIPLQKIEYYAFKEKFFKVVIYFEDINSRVLKHYLSSIYGEPTYDTREFSNLASKSFFWRGKKVDIKLIRQTSLFSFNEDEEDCKGTAIKNEIFAGDIYGKDLYFYSCLSFTYKPTVKQIKKIKEAQDRMENKKATIEQKTRQKNLSERIKKDL